MTIAQENQCTRPVSYDYGTKTAQCGASVKGHPLKCDTCRTQAATANPAPFDIGRPSTEAALPSQ